MGDDWVRVSGTKQLVQPLGASRSVEYLNLPKPKIGIRTPLDRVTKLLSLFHASDDVAVVVIDAICHF